MMMVWYLGTPHSYTSSKPLYCHWNFSTPVKFTDSKTSHNPHK